MKKISERKFKLAPKCKMRENINKKLAKEKKVEEGI